MGKMEWKNWEIELLSHSSVKLKGTKTIYIDPWEVVDKVAGERADIVLVTHEHFDHCSPHDIAALTKDGGIVVAPEECRKKLLELDVKKVFVGPGKIVNHEGITVEAVPAYNTNKFRDDGKPYHPRDDGKVGYVVDVGFRIYHAGDTDFIPEMRKLGEIDIAFLPVSGTYVMTAEEAAKAAMEISPKIAIPMHYGKIVGSREDAEKFRELLEGSGIRVEILL